MRIAIISDIHSNLDALNSVIKDINNEGVELVYCCGDIVGYGPEPEECITLTKQICLANDKTYKIVIGNHDEAAHTGIAESFNLLAKTAINWTREHLTQEGLDFLSSLPLSISENNMLFVHGSPYQPGQWHYIMDFDAMYLNLHCFKESVCFIGHTHAPFIVSLDKEAEPKLHASPEVVFEFDKGIKYLINVGSVGQSRDRDPRASYGIYDVSENIFKIKRVPYSVIECQRKMLKAGIPHPLIERLQHGW